MRFNCRCGKPDCNESAVTALRFKIFNESAQNNRQKMMANAKMKHKGSMTDIAKKLGIKIKEEFLTEDALVESKADQQKFIDKFGKEYFDIFWNSKQRLKNKGVNVDILWHVKNTSLSDMRKILDSISDEQRAKEVDIEGNRLPEPTGNYDVVFESEDYIVYHPHDYVSSIYCAKGGRWCTAGGYMIPEGQVKVSQAKQYFNQYTDRGVNLYYFIKSDGDRYALAVYSDGESYEVYNKRDENIGDVEEIPGIENIEIDGLDLENMRGNGTAATCENCGTRMHDEDIYWGPNDYSVYCESCFFDLCAFCGKCGLVFYEEDVIKGPDGEYYCKECAADKFAKCSYCDEYTEIDSLYWTDHGDEICDDCLRREGFSFCGWCGDVMTDDDYTEIDDDLYCPTCVDRVADACSNCGVVHLKKNLEYVDGKEYCPDCYENNMDESFNMMNSSSFRFRLTEDIAAVKKNYPKISDEDFDRVIRLDPTFDEGRDSVGQYGKWLLNLFNKGRLDDEGHAKDCLSRFEEEKKNLKNRDIGQFKSLDEVDNYLNDEDNYKDKTHRQEVRGRQKDRKSVDLTKEAEVAYKDNFWTVWVPDTYAASCKLGQGSKWCTASTESDYYFKYYNSQGPLYIVLNNADANEKYQFHFETSSFMDIDDTSIDLIGFLREEEGLFEFFKECIYGYIGLDESDIVDGEITTSVYDEDDYKDVFDSDAEFIYSIIGADGDPYKFFDFGYTNVELGNIPDFKDFPQNVKEELHRLGILSEEDFEENFEDNGELFAAFQAAYDMAEVAGSCNEASKIIMDAIEYADGEFKDGEIYISITEDELLDNLEDYLYDCYQYDDIIKSIFKDKFEYREPYYGYSGFDYDVFYTELEYRLGEL